MARAARRGRIARIRHMAEYSALRQFAVAGFLMRDFYSDTLMRLLRDGVLSTESTILVTCGGEFDRDTFVRCGFTKVTISNVDSRAHAPDFAPFEWRYEDAEQLTASDESFDFVVAHSGLHHCRSPHRALLEMYRVARRGVIVFEPRAGLITRIGQRLGFGQRYELAAVVANDMRFGGVENSEIPNFVYRWSPADVVQTISSFAPHAQHRFLFFHALRLPLGAVALRSRARHLLLRLLHPIAGIVGSAFPFLANNICFVVLKPSLPADLHPWLRLTDSGVKLNDQWVRSRFKTPDVATAATANGSDTPAR
jgi:SAM-dependent methyltransferase